MCIDVNDSTIEAWNTVLYDKFSRYKHLLIAGLGQHGTALFERYPPPVGGRVLDIGCGFGDTTVQLTTLGVGEAIGVDCAPRFIEAAEEQARQDGVDNARFFCADVQLDDLRGPYDAVYSRFGTMFFASPVAAFRNIRRSLAPGAPLVMSVWRKRQDNPCFYVAQMTVETYIDPEDEDENQVTCGPGPFSMAGADLVSDQLMASGFGEAQFIRHDAPICIGKDIDEALGYARALGPAGELLRLAETKAQSVRDELDRALREALQPYVRPDGVWAMSSTWLVKAVAV